MQEVQMTKAEAMSAFGNTDCCILDDTAMLHDMPGNCLVHQTLP
jgi:hypothetical protein